MATPPNVTFAAGDILNADVDALVNTVNCVGIMGRGIALQFKNAFPANFEDYAAACARGDVNPGTMFVHDTNGLTSPRYIINFPTKRHWRGKSRIEDVESGLVALVGEIRKRRIRSIAIPPLGAGLGGLAWPLVRDRILTAVAQLEDTKVVVYEPRGAPDPKVMARTASAPPMTVGRAALVVLMHRYLSGLLDPFVTLIEVHKLLYFMQAAGQDLRLRYTKALYGPYAENLSHVLKKVEGHYITGYADGGDAPTKQLELVPGALKEAENLLANDAEVAQRFAKVAELVDGFESPFGLELLATVHWIATEDPSADLSTVTSRIRAWNARKRIFTDRQIEVAFSRLRETGWTRSANS